MRTAMVLRSPRLRAASMPRGALSSVLRLATCVPVRPALRALAARAA